MARITLTEGKDFTPTALMKYLNDEHGGKSSGEKFNLADIQQYERRGYLPKKYGGMTIEAIKNDKIGVKYLKLK